MGSRLPGLGWPVPLTADRAHPSPGSSFGAYPVGLGAYPVGFEGKISIGALDIFNGGVTKSNGGIEKGQWGHWSGPMGVLKRVNGAVGQGQ